MYNAAILFISKNKGVPLFTRGGRRRPLFAGSNMDEMIKNFLEVGYQYIINPDLCHKLHGGLEHPLPTMYEGISKNIY